MMREESKQQRICRAPLRAGRDLDDGLVERATIYTDIDQARAAAERLAEELG
jgi:hypothetical protein